MARSSSAPTLVVRPLGLAAYVPTAAAMQDFASRRTPQTADELWLLEHPPVYTMGLKGRHRGLASTLRDIPLVQTDRGGDLTYHGPGQLVAYLLLDLGRLGLGIKELVWRIEQAVIDVLAVHGLRGERRVGAPGVYVDGAKIAALGLRVHRGSTYHGLSLNVNPDLTPFSHIDPCGYRGLAVTSLHALGVAVDMGAVAAAVHAALAERLGYNAGAETASVATRRAAPHG